MLEFCLQFAGVAGLTALSDVMWTLYFIETANRNAAKAAGWSAMTVGLGAVATLGYVHDMRLLAAAMLGAFIGTLITIRYAAKLEKENE